jgi:hypothetical protein
VKVVIRHKCGQQQPLTFGKRLINQFRAVKVYEIEGVKMHVDPFGLCALQRSKVGSAIGIERYNNGLARLRNCLKGIPLRENNSVSFLCLIAMHR